MFLGMSFLMKCIFNSSISSPLKIHHCDSFNISTSPIQTISHLYNSPRVIGSTSLSSQSHASLSQQCTTRQQPSPHINASLPNPSSQAPISPIHCPSDTPTISSSTLKSHENFHHALSPNQILAPSSANLLPFLHPIRFQTQSPSIWYSLFSPLSPLTHKHHPMITRSKHGIYKKPKAWSVTNKLPDFRFRDEVIQ